jgi:hypothetical protein
MPHPLGAHVRELRRRRDDAGVGDDGGQRSKGFGRRVEYCNCVGLDRDVALQGDSAAAAFGDRLNHGVRRFRVLAIIDPDRPAVLGGEQCAGAADAAKRQ